MAGIYAPDSFVFKPGESVWTLFTVVKESGLHQIKTFSQEFSEFEQWIEKIAIVC